MNTNTPLTLYTPAQYRLRLQGLISVDCSDWLANSAVRFEGSGASAETVIMGTVRDQAALFGLLSFIRDLGVPLISVENIRMQSKGENL